MREGAELVRATQQYAKEQPLRTWWYFLSTAFVYWGLVAFVIWIPSLLGQFAASILIGLVIVRLFIIYHDYQHGAVFRKSKLGKIVMYWPGLLVLAVPSVWKETHDYHHRSNARLLGSAIGSYPLVTVGIWKGMKPEQRKMYRFVRHPLTIIFGLFTAFMIGMSIAPFRRNPRAHWLAPVALVLWWVVGALVTVFLGWRVFLFAQLIPGILSGGMGSYLFYAQHNFPGAEMRDRRKWNYHHAAMRCSSMFEMSAIMHWFTGNIGYHHLHHLNHRIPFYRLKEAMDALPEAQSPVTTSWAIRDVVGCLRLGLWDPEQRAMISIREGEEIIAAQQSVAAK